MNVGPLQIAIIGCGWAGQQHARACAALGVQVRWAVDSNLARATALARSLPQTDHGPRTTPAYQDALADPTLDAVSICLPHNLHAPVAIDAARAGVHVLVEKPLAANLAEADGMIAAAGDASAVLMVAENVRFDAVYLTIRQLLREGAIGKPALLQITRQCYLRESFLRDRPWFLDARAAAGGIMMSGGIHDFETMRMLVGEVDQVYALRAPQRFLEMEGDDTSIAAIHFQNGTVGTLVESFIMKSLTTAAGPEVHTLRVDGELGHIAWDGGRTVRVFSEHADWEIGGRLSQHEIDVPQTDSFMALLEHFIHCIESGQEPITSGRSSRVPLAWVMAAYESMDTGQPVKLL
jgi:predicted dehydrogenase